MLANVKLGDVPTWLAAIFTGLTLAFSLWLIWTQRREAKEEKERKQAILVSAWPGDLRPPLPDQPDTFASLGFFYQNRSDEPVYLMAVGTLNRGSADRTLIWRTVGTVGPGFRGQDEIGLPLEPEFNRTGADEGVVSRFREAAGRWWSRDQDGALSRLAKDPRERQFPTDEEKQAMGRSWYGSDEP